MNIGELNIFRNRSKTLDKNARFDEENDAKLDTLERFIEKDISKDENILAKKKIKIGPNNFSIFKDKISNKTTNYKRAKELEFLYYQYLYNSFFQCVFSISSIVCAVLQYEVEYNLKQANKEYNDSSTIYIATWFCFTSSVFLWITLFYEHFINSRINFLQKNLPEEIWLKQNSQLFSFAMKILINFFHPNPFLIGIDANMYNEKYEINTIHSFNSLMAALCLLRITCLFKFYLIYSDYYSPRSQRICQMNNFDTSLLYSMKASMTKTPYNAYLILFLTTLFYFSYCLRIFERVLDEKSGKNFSSFFHTIWCLIITMTTVGYGDFFPSSLLGRLIGIFACIFGIFLLSMLIVTITNVLNFEATEENVFNILQRIKLAKEKDQVASKFVAKYLRSLKELKNKKMVKKSMKEAIMLDLHYFKDTCKKLDDTFPGYGDFDIVQDQLRRVESSVDELQYLYDDIENEVKYIADRLRGKTGEN